MICVNWIELSQYSICLKPGSWYYGMYASVCPSNATNPTIVWSSSDPSVASVGYSDGYIHANGTGTARIIAHATDGSGVTSFCTVQVTDTVKISSITFDQTDYVLEKDHSIYIAANICPSTASNTTLSWSSSDGSVARVSDGTVCGIGAGNATITARATDGSGVSASCNILVTENILAKGVKLEHNSLLMYVGEETYINYEVRPTTASQEVTWSSTDSSIATVNEGSGRITALKEGTVAIYATAKDGSGCRNYCCVTVREKEVIKICSIEIKAEKQTMTVGESMKLTATIYLDDATDKSLIWTSSNEDVVTVGNNGIVCAEGPGKATITVSSVDDCEVSGSIDITVNSYIAVTGVSVSPKGRTLSEGETAKITATIEPSDATNQNVVWRSSAPGVAEVDPHTGIVTPIFDGRATITATTQDGGYEDVCYIKVDIKEDVIVERDTDGVHCKIVFPDGKVWNCINIDFINEKNLDLTDTESQRCYENIYEEKVLDPNGIPHYQEPFKTYTDEEIKVIYTVDPHGLAAYVREYAEQSSGANLDLVLGYKDDIFYLIFNRHPKYFARNLSGNWHQTTNISNPHSVLSESELLFGIHPIYDINTLYEFIPVAIDVISLAIQVPGITKLLKKMNGKVKKIAKLIFNIFSLSYSVTDSVLYDDFNGFVNALVNFSIDINDWEEEFMTPSEYSSKNYTVGWAIELISFSSDLQALADTFNIGPHFYKYVFEKCESDLDYNILIRTPDNKLLSISEINDVIE